MPSYLPLGFLDSANALIITIGVILGSTFLVGFNLSIRRESKISKKLVNSEDQRNELARGEKRILEFLHHLGLSTTNEHTRDKLYEVIAEGVTRVTKSDGAALFLIALEEDQLYPKYVTKGCLQLTPQQTCNENEDFRSTELHHPLEKHSGLIGQSLSKNTPFLTNSILNHPSIKADKGHFRQDCAAMIAPLIHAGHQIGVLAVTKPHDPNAYTMDDLFTFSSIAEQSAFAIGNFDAHSHAADKKQIERELQSAKEVQTLLIPRTDPNIPGYKISGYNIPARMISGDYYDYTPISTDKTGIIIADVSGKGVPAGIIMATFRSTLKAISEGVHSPSKSLSQLNKLIHPDIREDMFISAIYAQLEHHTGKVTLARAGHNPAYYYKAEDKTLSKLKSPGLAVGIDSGELFETILKDHTISMSSGDILLLYTDGIIEANDLSDDQYSASRLEALLLTHHTKNAKDLSTAILDDIRAFVGNAPQSDDITLVAIKKV